MPLGTLEFYAADWSRERICHFMNSQSTLFSVNHIKAEWTSKWNDVASRELADYIASITGWKREVDQDTQDDTCSKVIFEIEATEKAIHDLHTKLAELSPGYVHEF